MAAATHAYLHTWVPRVDASWRVAPSPRYDPDPRTTVIAEDLEWVRDNALLEDENSLANLSPWLLRLELHRNVMVDKQLPNTEIAIRIGEEYGEALYCMYSDDNADKRIIRVGVAVPYTDFGKNLPQSSISIQTLAKY